MLAQHVTLKLTLAWGAGDWFCSPQCSSIREQLTACVQRGDMPVQGCEDVSWQILRGSDGTEATAEALNLAQTILQVCELGLPFQTGMMEPLFGLQGLKLCLKFS